MTAQVTEFNARELCSRKLWQLVNGDDVCARQLQQAVDELAARRHYLEELAQMGKLEDNSGH